MGVICTPEDGGGGPPSVTMAVMFLFVLSSVLRIHACWKAKANVNKGSRNAPLVCYYDWREDVAAPFGFFFKADRDKKFRVHFVCV